jgi:hypothetical protein
MQNSVMFIFIFMLFVLLCLWLRISANSGESILYISTDETIVGQELSSA